VPFPEKGEPELVREGATAGTSSAT
jgi:hypothetical protein